MLKHDITIKEWLQQATAKLTAAGIESARLDSILLLEEVLQKQRDWILAHDDESLRSGQIKKLNEFLKRREERTPLAYIIGSKEFYGRKFMVSSDVLIPRPESEATIDLLKKIVDSSTVWSTIETLHQNNEPQLQTHDNSLFTILDVGTGSGCLAITAKLALPEIQVVATDISKPALKIAQQNARNLGAKVKFMQADLLALDLNIQPLVVLANLPYVPYGLITSEEINKEPAVALFSGTDGLDHYRKLWQQIKQLTYEPEFVITESLLAQHKAIKKLAAHTGYNLEMTQDLVQCFKLIS